jgi:hypothetical protein
LAQLGPTLQYYFDSHPIRVVSSCGLGDIVNNRVSSRPLALMGLNITYAPRTAIKSQVLADFVAEWTEE